MSGKLIDSIRRGLEEAIAYAEGAADESRNSAYPKARRGPICSSSTAIRRRFKKRWVRRHKRA